MKTISLTAARPQLLRRFDFQLVYPYRPWKSANFNIFLQSEMWVTVVLREEQAMK